MKTRQIDYGCTTHVHAMPEPGDNHTPEAFERNIRLMKEAGCSWVRFDVRPWDVAREEGLRVYDRAIASVGASGMNVFLVIQPPDAALLVSAKEYQVFFREYIRMLVLRWQGMAAVWQVFNEADTHHFRDYSSLSSLSPDYLHELGTLSVLGSNIIKKIDKKAKITMNIAHYAGSPWGDIYEKGFRFFDAVVTPLDFLSLDVYPLDSEEEIARLPEYVKRFGARYGKRVAITEIGLSNSAFTQEQQEKYLSESIQVLRSSQSQPVMTLLYELMDQICLSDPIERSYGLLLGDGTPKRAWKTVMNNLNQSLC